MKRGQKFGTAAVVALAALGCVGLGYAAPQGGPEPETGIGATVSRLFGNDPRQQFQPRVDYASLDARIRQVMTKPDMVGLGVAIIEDGRIAFVKGYGTTTANGTEPVGAHTVFRWASLSKGVAATMVAELANEGRLDLEAPVSRYSTQLKLPGGGENVATVDDVLSQRVGVVRNAFDDKLEAGGDPRLLRAQYATLARQCAPGACHAYQNVSYDTASEIVQNITGRPYQLVVTQRLFQPLGMTDASVSRAGLMSAQSWARPHVGRTTVEVNDSYYRVPAAGGVNSSIIDMARWMQAQVGGDPQVVPQPVLDEIHRPRITTDRHLGVFNKAMGPNRYSLGWRDYTYLGHHLVGHQGAVRGYRATILLDPVRKSGIALLWNSQSARPPGIQLEYLDRLYGLPRKDWLGLDAAASTVTAESE
jgi:beta-lactamase class C